MIQSAVSGVLLDHVQDKVVLLDEDGRITYGNESVRRILGWDPEELIGKNAFEYIHPEDLDTVRTAFERTIASQSFTETTAEYRHKTKDGSWVWLESRMANVTDDKLNGYVVSSRDITDRIDAQRECREITERLEEISSTAGDVLWMFNSDWSELLFVNPAYEDIYGQPVGDVRTDPSAFMDVIHPKDVPAVRDAMDQLSRGESVDMEYRVNPEKDYRVWVWVQAEPITEDGEVVRIAGFSRDITDRYRRERQLYVMDNLLRHNIRNDMGVIMGNAEVIEEEAPEVADKTAIIRQTGEDLLASADKERRIIDVLTSRKSLTDVDLGDVVLQSVERVEERFPKARIDVALSGDASVHALDDIQLAVVELLENAISHSDRERPSIRVAVQPTGDTVSLVVRDDGPAIPEMEADVLTGEHNMNDVYHSTGLGLWLIYWIVELSDGTVDVSSEDGGNRIRLGLPRSE